MYRIAEGQTGSLDDVESFISDLNANKFADCFDPDEDIILTRAPGRLDVMGGIADYSGSLVLQMPIAEATLAAAQFNRDDVVRIESRDKHNRVRGHFDLSLSELRDLASVSYAGISARFRADKEQQWASYVAGTFLVLAKEVGVAFDSGVNILIMSDVPAGKGVSSSAALEVAAMQAVRTLFKIPIKPRQLALLCQRVENHIAGAACGVMDQVTSHCGVEGNFTALVCQPAEILDPVPIPDQLEFWGIDSGVRHAVVGSDYTSVRTAAFMGYRIIAELAHLVAHEVAPGRVEVRDERWRGYLANVSVNEYQRGFCEYVPDELAGGDFLAQYGGITDPVTTVDPARTYSIRVAAEHAIYENARVQRYAQLITQPGNEAAWTEMGELMFASHASYKACGLTEPRTDRLVKLVREHGDKGLYGARITGGGSGGTVAVMARKGSKQAITEVVSHYRSETGYQPRLFFGSSPGASSFGRLRLATV